MHQLVVRTKALALLLLMCHLMVSQSHYRFSADYSIKEIDTNQTQKISLGKVYLDHQTKFLNFKQVFPDQKVYSFSDSVVIVSTGDTSFTGVAPKGLFQFTIYSLILTNQLDNYGLDDTKCKLINVSQKEGKVIREYVFLEGSNRKMHLVKSDQDLIEVMLILNDEDEVISKSFLEEYHLIKGLMVPHRVVQFWYSPSRKVSKKISTLKHVILDQKTDNHHYSHQ